MLRGIARMQEPNSSASRDPGRDEETLLRRYLEHGDRRAIGDLLDRHTDLAYRVALRFLRNPSDAEDAAQSAFLAILRHARRYRTGIGVKVWLVRIVMSVCRNRLQEGRRRDQRESAVRASAPSPSPEASMLERESREHLMHAVEELPEHYREPMLLHYYEGFSVQETAAGGPATIRAMMWNFSTSPAETGFRPPKLKTGKTPTDGPI